jgi:hypothetical protein
MKNFDVILKDIPTALQLIVLWILSPPLFYRLYRAIIEQQEIAVEKELQNMRKNKFKSSKTRKKKGHGHNPFQ